MIDDAMAGKALAAFDMTFGGRCDDAHLKMWTNKMRAALEAVAPMIRDAAIFEARSKGDIITLGRALELVKAARAMALAEAMALVRGYAETVKNHGNLATAPYSAAEQAADEIESAIRALKERGE